jgi:hypothetical protein
LVLALIGYVHLRLSCISQQRPWLAVWNIEWLLHASSKGPAAWVVLVYVRQLMGFSKAEQLVPLDHT